MAVSDKIKRRASLKITLGSGVIGNTSAFGAEDSRFEPWLPSQAPVGAWLCKKTGEDCAADRR